MKKVLYFGYGANRDADMMEAIIGRRPSGFPAKLDGYELYVQTWEEIPADVRKILERAWDSSFRTYCIRQSSGSAVAGTAWHLTRPERELVGEWEIHGLWYQPVEVQVKDYSGQTFDAETEIINNPNIRQVVDGENYSTFLNSRQKMFKAANAVREEYLQQASS